MLIKGIAASKGIAIAKVFKIEELPLDITQKTSNKDEELKLYDNARELVKTKIQASAKLASSSEHAAIFEAHLNFLEDPSALEAIRNDININNYTAEYATKSFYNNFAAIFESMDDAYMKERAADIRDVCKKLLYALNNIEETDLTQISEEVIIVAEDLSPSQTVQLNKKYVKGFVTNIGGPTSHTAIMARSLGIPSVVGTNSIMKHAQNGQLLALDGTKGEVLLNPSEVEIAEFKKQEQLYRDYLNKLKELKGKKSITTDGHEIEIEGNIGTPNDVESVLENDAQGIGLFRSEFLYMDNENWPTEDEQFLAYKKVIEQMNNQRVVIRTLDIGGDKTLKYYKFPEELNPFLGFRAIRFCLQNEDVFKTQLKALIRASEFGRVSVMFPMITTLDEFLRAKNTFEECYKEVSSANPKVAKREDIELGLMIETPAAAVLTEQFCKYADFVSIGTNDLIQYSMASDRMNENVSYLYQPLNPSILKLVKMTIDGAHKYGKWAGMCGEMAGDKRAFMILLGLGLDKFSMSASSVLSIRDLVRNTTFARAKEIANHALSLETETQVLEYLKSENLL